MMVSQQLDSRATRDAHWVATQDYNFLQDNETQM